MSVAENVVPLEKGRERLRLESPPSLYPPVLLQADNYELEYVAHEVRKQFGRGVLVVYFVVVEHLPKCTTVVSRYYQVKLGKAGHWRPAKHGALVREFMRLFPYRRLPRLDRFPVSWLRDRHVVGRVGTVEKDHEQNLLDDSSYSVVRELVRCCS